jgi:hypothetical protein
MLKYSVYAGRARLQRDGTCAEDTFRVWQERTSPYAANMKCGQFSSLLEAGSCVRVARNGLTHSAVLFSLHFPSLTQVCAIT